MILQVTALFGIFGIFIKFSGTTPGIIVHLDGQKISFSKQKPFEDYCKMYIKDQVMDNGAPLQLLYEKPDNKEAKGRWEVGFAISDIGFQNISFVNSIATTKGGQHVNVIADQLVKKLEEVVNRKNKGGLKVRLENFQFIKHILMGFFSGKSSSNQNSLLDLCQVTN